jgi:hypothetical protein
MLELFKGRKPIIAVVHLPPLPGSPRWAGSMSQVLQWAAQDTQILAKAGADAILVENFGDMPFPVSSSPPETVAAMTLAAAEAVRSCSVPVGLNVLRNDAASAVAIAAATGAAFIRVNVHCGVAFSGEGILVGGAHETLRLRQRLAPHLAIFADILVKHAWAALGWPDAASGFAQSKESSQKSGQMPPNIAQLARDTAYRGLADALIVTGAATGEAPDFTVASQVKDAAPDRPVLIGSGVTAQTVKQALSAADGIIVGSALKESGKAGNRADAERARMFFGAARG